MFYDRREMAALLDSKVGALSRPMPKCRNVLCGAEIQHRRRSRNIEITVVSTNGGISVSLYSKPVHLDEAVRGGILFTSCYIPAEVKH